MEDTAEKYRLLKKLNYLIMTLNSTYNKNVKLEVPQQYTHKLVERLGSENSKDNM